MTLSVKHPPYKIPTYSLTGDLLSYLTCGLQYRYHNRGSLPPSTPVQLWFGEFIHGVMEEAYLRWKAGRLNAFPYDEWKPEIWDIETTVDKHRLSPKGLVPPSNLFDRNGVERRIASRRAAASLNVWAPELFPLIDEAEVRLRGIRALTPPNMQPRADYYEVQGVVDVLGSMTLNRAGVSNRVVKFLRESLGDISKLGDSFEVIVDYKGMRRPHKNDPKWEQYAWQLRTYAWLRRMQPASLPTAAGVLLFLNELEPSVEDMGHLQEEVDVGSTDVMPQGKDLEALQKWTKKSKGRSVSPPNLSLDYRIKRSIRVVTVDDLSVQASLQNFDQTVWEIEGGVDQEVRGASIQQAWGTPYLQRHRRPAEATCTACDFKSYCPILAKAQITVP
ncbi:MAG: PD-(D/E)XK nuclease family protein [Nitrososphaerota archaeon]|nr:PD-(D/E)XK nuclease family protein [Nitrososphaerota archaeon]